MWLRLHRDRERDDGVEAGGLRPSVPPRPLHAHLLSALPLRQPRPAILLQKIHRRDRHRLERSDQVCVIYNLYNLYNHSSCQVLHLRRSLPRPSSLQLAEAGGPAVPQGHALSPPGQGLPRPDLLRPRGPLSILRRPHRHGGQEHRGHLQGVAGEVSQHLGGKK